MSDMDNIIYTETSFKKLDRKPEIKVNERQRSIWKEMGQELLSNKFALIGLFLLIIIIIAVLLAPLSPYEPNTVDVTSKLQPPSKAHWFGTDDFGRDYFTRALYGGRVSLLVGFGAMLVTSLLGTSIGVFSGYIGGKTDFLVMRCTDIFLALPSTLLMIVLNTFLQPNLITLILVLSLFSWAPVARVTRAETLSIKERDYVKASENLGAGAFHIIIKHIVPNLASTVIVSATLGIAGAILMESSLSYLGLGVQIPQASWGSMLQNAQSYILNAPLLAIYPGVLILITVLSFNLLGDVLRAALEPKEEK